MLLTDKEFIGFENVKLTAGPDTNTKGDLVKHFKGLPTGTRKQQFQKATKFKLDGSGQMIVSGKLNNITIIDFDDRATMAVFLAKKEFEFLLDTAEVKTRRGSHFYVEHDERLPGGTDVMEQFEGIDILTNDKLATAPLTTYSYNGKTVKYKINNQPIIKLSDEQVELLLAEIKPVKLSGPESKVIESANAKADEATPDDVGDIEDYAGLIKPEYVEDYDHWCKIVWAFKSRGLLALSRKISKKSSKYKQSEHDNLFNGNGGSKVKLNTIYYYANLSDPEAFRALNAAKSNRVTADSLFDLHKLLLNTTYKGRLLKCNKVMYFKTNRGWEAGEHEVKDTVFKDICNLDLWFKSSKDDPVSVKHSIRHIEDLVKYVTKNAPIDNGLLDRIWDHTLLKLYFKNGYYDFRVGQFMPTDNETFITIDRDLNLQSNPTLRQEIYDRVFDPIFTVTDSHPKVGERRQLRDYFLRKLARMMAGEIGDKEWVSMYGFRDCGKGVISDFMKGAFQKYVTTTNAENFMPKPAGGDSAKALSFMVDHIFKRLVSINEAKNHAQKKVSFCGTIIKKYASGGDLIEARKNYKDEAEFKIQSSLMFNFNDFPDVSPSDALEKCVHFECVSKFVDADFDESQKLTTIHYYASDPSVKEVFIKRADVQNELVLMLIEAYSNGAKYPAELKKDIKDNNGNDDMAKLLDAFEFTGNIEDIVTNKRLKSVGLSLGLVFQLKKMKVILMGKGAVEHRTNKERGLKGLKVKREDESDDEDPYGSVL